MVLPNCLFLLKLFCIALRIPWLLDCWYSQTTGFLHPLQRKRCIFYVTLKLCNCSLQTFLSNLWWPAHFFGLPCEMTLEKIALMTVAGSCESRLKLLSSLPNCVTNSCSYPSPAVLSKELFNTNGSVAVILTPCYLDLECDKTGL